MEAPPLSTSLLPHDPPCMCVSWCLRVAAHGSTGPHFYEHATPFQSSEKYVGFPASSLASQLALRCSEMNCESLCIIHTDGCDWQKYVTSRENSKPFLEKKNTNELHILFCISTLRSNYFCFHFFTQKSVKKRIFLHFAVENVARLVVLAAASRGRLQMSHQKLFVTFMVSHCFLFSRCLC